eukprot:RCo017254
MSSLLHATHFSRRVRFHASQPPCLNAALVTSPAYLSSPGSPMETTPSMPSAPESPFSLNPPMALWADEMDRHDALKSLSVLLPQEPAAAGATAAPLRFSVVTSVPPATGPFPASRQRLPVRLAPLPQPPQFSGAAAFPPTSPTTVRHAPATPTWAVPSAHRNSCSSVHLAARCRPAVAPSPSSRPLRLPGLAKSQFEEPSERLNPMSCTAAPTPAADSERELLEAVVGLLKDKAVNPHNGSVSLDSLKRAVIVRHSELCHAVMGPQSSLTDWRDFVRRHCETLCLVRRSARLKRIYLKANLLWRENDKKMADELTLRERHIVGCLETVLQRRQQQRELHLRSGGSETTAPPPVRLQEFIEVYPSLPQNQSPKREEPAFPELPRMPDLLRLLRRYQFEIDEETSSITRVQSPSCSSRRKKAS